jgi:hypothetical protein
MLVACLTSMMAAHLTLTMVACLKMDVSLFDYGGLFDNEGMMAAHLTMAGDGCLV